MSMKNVNEKIKPEQCCGCGACYNTCPIGAISMDENEEGFLTPVIDKDKCTNCGLCTKTCPTLNVKYKNNQEPVCYAAMAHDDIRMKSSSGGVFTLLAEHIIAGGGYVCGAAFDKDWNVHHIIVNNKNDLEKLRGSKYVQSDIGTCYKEIKVLLDNDKSVLFSGTPCQVAGLYSFLGKDYEKLYTVDLICHGTPSPGVWKKYLRENYDIENIEKISFRDKSVFNWSVTMNIYFKDGTEYHKKQNEDVFYRGFLPCLISREHCGKCMYSKLPRQGDISLGDWWVIDKFKKGLNDKKGTSQVLVNSPKGEYLFKKISSKLKLNKQLSLETTLKSRNAIDHCFTPHPKRERFFKLFSKNSVNKSIIDTIENKYDVCLVTIFHYLNYGSILVAYACNKLIENLGYNVLMLQEPNPKRYFLNNGIAHKFAKKYYNIAPYYNYTDLRILNNYCDIFVAASDQIFLPYLAFDCCFLEWVNNEKNKIAFGTSFGHDKFSSPREDIIKKQYLLDRFNHIALREKSENLCNNIFKINAEEIIDPTLILPLKEWDKLAETVELRIGKPYLLTYTLDLTEEKVKAIKYIADKLKLDIININNLDQKERKIQNSLIFDKNYTPEEFLYLYKNASFVVTDSYHGTCFSVKYNKPFVSFKNTWRGELRYKLFDKLKVSEHIISDANDVFTKPELLENIDYTETNKIIQKETEFAIKWLDNALKTNNSDEKFSHFENYMDIKLKEENIPLVVQNVALSIVKDVVNYPKYCFNYYRCKLLANITFGQKRQHYIKKKRNLKAKIKKYRNYFKG